MAHPHSYVAGGPTALPDTSGAYAAMNPSMPMGAAPVGPSSAAAAALGGLNMAAAAGGSPLVASSSDPIVRYTVDRAMAEVRTADRRARQIIAIEVAAKQLALNILAYEEDAGHDEQGGGVGSGAGGGDPHGGMGDDSAT